MRPIHQIARILLVAALFAATGGHWAVLQTVAWSSMLVQYSHGANLASAVQQTFDGRHPCALCKKIDQARHNEKKPDVQFASGKLEFCYHPVKPLLLRPGNFWQMHPGDVYPPAFAEQPPVPPPRDTIS